MAMPNGYDLIATFAVKLKHIFAFLNLWNIYFTFSINIQFFLYGPHKSASHKLKSLHESDRNIHFYNSRNLFL